MNFGGLFVLVLLLVIVLENLVTCQDRLRLR